MVPRTFLALTFAFQSKLHYRLLSLRLVSAVHEFQRDGITVCTTYVHFKHENTRRHAKTIYIL